MVGKSPRNGELHRSQIVPLALLLLVTVWPDRAFPQGAAASPKVEYINQGWSDADRATFYTTGQGSHIIPYAWFKALRRLDVDEPFGADELVRYGYLENDDPANTEGLPVGFVLDPRSQPVQLGMSCAACHTGQLEYQQNGSRHLLRLDGAPSNADFQQFLTDLLAASRATLARPDRFTAFAKDVLGPNAAPGGVGDLRDELGRWVKQFGGFMDNSLPATQWGPGRLDAFGMIFNRAAGKDLGVDSNFKVADAPVSYPFLWNAPRQDRTQWNGGVDNGLYIQGLARNTGEVFGVFADFSPRRLVPATQLTPAVADFGVSSVNFAGLETLEEKIAILQPPAWPRAVFKLDEGLVTKGAALFQIHCATCHTEKVSRRSARLWETPVLAVGTDPKMVLNAQREGDPGLLTGVLMPPPHVTSRFANPVQISALLGGSVVGSLLDEALLQVPTPARMKHSGVWRAINLDLGDLLPGQHIEDFVGGNFAAMKNLKASIELHLSNLYTEPPAPDSGPSYEARVLHGIWATAPYLHNGSVPNLWELMKPANERVSTFQVGSRVFDPKNVGYATEQSPFKNGTFVADPAGAPNGNGNQGHEYGTDLSPDDRWAIIEYLKTL